MKFMSRLIVYYSKYMFICWQFGLCTLLLCSRWLLKVFFHILCVFFEALNHRVRRVIWYKKCNVVRGAIIISDYPHNCYLCSSFLLTLVSNQPSACSSTLQISLLEKGVRCHFLLNTAKFFDVLPLMHNKKSCPFGGHEGLLIMSVQ